VIGTELATLQDVEEGEKSNLGGRDIVEVMCIQSGGWYVHEYIDHHSIDRRGSNIGSGELISGPSLEANPAESTAAL